MVDIIEANKNKAKNDFLLFIMVKINKLIIAKVLFFGNIELKPANLFMQIFSLLANLYNKEG